MEEEEFAVYTTKTGAKSLERLMTIAKEVSKDLKVESFDEIEVLMQDSPEILPKKKLLGFRWYGGKYSHLDWLLPLLPKTTQFCEPFGGSAAVLLNKEPSPIETFNDIDGAVVNFFKVLRDRPNELIEKLYLTPFAREQFVEAYLSKKKTDIDAIERARLFFVSAEQVRIGLAQTATPGRWAYCVLTSRRGMSGAVSRWINRIEALWAVSERLRSVQLENLDAIKVIKKYDTPETLFYCDPPYVHESRGDIKAYGFEMTTENHESLSDTLHSIKGNVALSGYNSPIMERLYNDWNRIDAEERIAHSVKQKRQESLWINYKLNTKKPTIQNKSPRSNQNSSLTKFL